MVESGKKRKVSEQSHGDRQKPPSNIFIAVKMNKQTDIEKALKENPECINYQEEDTLMTPLHWGCANRSLPTAELLFEQVDIQVDPWLKDTWGRYPMDIALTTGNQTLIDMLHKKMFPEDYEHDFDPLDPPKGALFAISSKFGEE
ncbi:MAG: hypothetical protein CO093_08540 [Alphaproteobacteria bacterium CG_4_9_14_3_um_filter_47_13]|nr:MAG: hypothetical protein CO093_08540 [Alphaproteobacteria bacterium CG_4_9_14_3_um_filter_47_13]